MLMDDRSKLAGNLLLPTSALGTFAVGDTLDTANLAAFSSDTWLVVQVAQTFASAGAATLQLHLVSDATSAIATDGSASYHLSTGAIGIGRLVQGATLAVMPLPVGLSHERYLGLLITIGTAAFSAGSSGRINAFITTDPSAYRPYADNVA